LAEGSQQDIQLVETTKWFAERREKQAAHCVMTLPL
jgi:hypothetical protein